MLQLNTYVIIFSCCFYWCTYVIYYKSRHLYLHYLSHRPLKLSTAYLGGFDPGQCSIQLGLSRGMDNPCGVWVGVLEGMGMGSGPTTHGLLDQ